MGRERRERERGGGNRGRGEKRGRGEWGKKGGERMEVERMRRAEEGGDASWAGGWRRERERARKWRKRKRGGGPP